MNFSHEQRTIPSVLCAALFAVACSGGSTRGALSPEWQNDHGESITALEQRLRGNKPPTGKGLAVGVVPAGIVAVALDNSFKWSHTMKLDARPAIAGDVVVATGDGQVTAIGARSGRVLWRISSRGKALRGAGDNGQVTVMTLGRPPGGASLFLAVDRNGKVVRSLDPEPDIGIPSILGDTAFIPWGSQYISAVDLKSGEEVARLLTRNRVTRAETIGSALFFGDESLVRFDENIGKAWHDEATSIVLPERNLPGKPSWFSTGLDVLPPKSSPRDRIHLYARPSTGSSVDGDRFAATYYRIALGLRATDGALEWARTLPDDVIGGDAAQGGFVLCDTKGRVWLIGAKNGENSGARSLGAPVNACVVQGGDFTVPPGSDVEPIAKQLSRAIETRDAHLVGAQQFLLKELGGKPEPEITKILIDLCSESRTAPALANDARNLLAARRTGAEFMLEALERRYDFLSGVLRPPPVGPLADALAAMNDRRAAPLLSAHLNDPANDTDDIRHAALALVSLASAREGDDLRTFFSLYRATADDDNIVAAVLAVARALLRVGGDVGQDMVRHAAVDPLTHPAVKEGLKVLVGEKG